ncbi:MAG: LysR substrate-binding domain-containing protein [Pigmentiphaga sp.]|nr:LysR substrate-binding domain-containing protein [Pigmentiphaga sp.]
MNLQQLRYLCAIVDAGFNISRAAQALHTSQPGISKQIRLLESRMGTSLLIRKSGRIIGLTDYGEQAWLAAKRILKEFEGLKQMGDDVLRQDSGRLTIATLHSYAYSLLPPVIHGLRQRYPEVSVDIRQATPGNIIELVRAGEADVGLTIERPAPDSGVLALDYRAVPRVLLVPAGHPLLEQETVAFRDIIRYPIIEQGFLSSGGWAVSRTLRAKGYDFEPALSLPDASTIKAYVEEGVGIAVISGAMFDPQRDANLRAIAVDHLFAPSFLTLVIDPHRYQRRYLYDFIESLAPNWDRLSVQYEVRHYEDHHGGAQPGNDPG